MRPASAVLEDLSRLIERTELPEFGARAAKHGRERWAIACARRAVGANVEWCGPALPVLREGLVTATRWLAQAPDDDQRDEANATIRAAHNLILAALRAASRGRINLERTARSAEAVALALDCAVGAAAPRDVAALARESFPDPEHEAASQARRLLLHTKLLPSGPELLVRLDYAESRGRLPQDQAQREWIESHRALLMVDDEAGRLAMILRHLELVFLAELERLGQIF